MQAIFLIVLGLGAAICAAVPLAGANLLRVWPVTPIYLAGVGIWLALVLTYVVWRRRRAARSARASSA